MKRGKLHCMSIHVAIESFEIAIGEVLRLNQLLSSFIAYRQVRNKSNTMGVTSGAGTAYPSITP
jgi:hypothetical protein